VRYDIEGFKGQQVQVTEKLSEMIKMEVDSRLSSDKETKVLIQNLIKNVMVELSNVKEQTDRTL
jgi:ethanolamine utilization protein EutQ (cupin superfamily)